jgi:hypothetical protein
MKIMTLSLKRGAAMLLVGISAFLFCTTVARAQIALQDGSLTIYPRSGATISNSFTVTAGAKVLVVSLMDKSASTGAAGGEPTNLFWGSQTLTLAAATNNGNATYRDVAIYYLFNPTPGTTNITGVCQPVLNGISGTAVQAYTLSGVDTNFAPLVGGVNNLNASSITFQVASVPTNGFAVVCGLSSSASSTFTITGTGGTTVTTTDNTDNGSTTTMGYIVGLSSGTVTFTGTAGSSTKVGLVAAIFTPVPAVQQGNSIWTGADIPNHNTNWTDRLNWSPATVPGSSSPVIFNSTGANSAQTQSALSTPGGGPGAIVASAINNIVNSNITTVSLTYTNTGGSYENTSISANDVLTLSSGVLTIGSPTLDFGNTTGNVTVTGPGTLNVNYISGMTYVGLGTTTLASTPQATLDLSGLGTFISANGNFLVGVGGFSSGGFTNPQPSGVVYLAQTNVITAVSSQSDSSDSLPLALEVGDADTLAGLPSTLYLGWSNAIYADGIVTGRQLASGGIFFNPVVTNANPAVYIRGYSASRVANWIIGDGVANGTATLASSGTNDFTGGSVDAQANTIYVGKNSSNISASGQTAGTLTFNSGTINVNNLNVSYNGAASGGFVWDSSAGTVNVGGTGLLVVNTRLNLAYVGGYAAYGTPPVGTLNITSGGSVWASTVAPGTNGGDSVINVSGGTLIVSNMAGTAASPLTSLNVTNGILGLGVSSFTVATINATAVNAGGATNIINIISLPALASSSYPVTFTLIQSSVPISPFNFGGSVPAGYTGSITRDDSGYAVVLTLTSGPATRTLVLWDGADSATTINWSDKLNWEVPGAPTINDNVIFNNTAPASGSPFNAPGTGSGGLFYPYNINNVADRNFTIASLTFTNFGISNFQNTWISNNVALSITGAGGLVVGNNASGLDFGNTAQEFVTIAGTNATLNINNPGATINVSMGTGAASSSQMATLDLSGLDVLNANVSQMLLGDTGLTGTAGAGNRPSAAVYLALTNTITAGYATATPETDPAGSGAVVVGDVGAGGTSGVSVALYLGMVNNISADTIFTGREKAGLPCLIQFNPNLTGGTPTANFTGYSGSQVQVWSIGDGAACASTTTCNAANDFSGGIVNALVNTMYVGRGSTTANGVNINPSTGILTFDAGTFNVDTLWAGLQSNSGTYKIGVGTINVNTNSALAASGTLIVNGTLNLASATANALTTSGTLNINNGTVLANNIVPGSGVSTINMYGGVVVASNSVGSAAAPLTMLDLSPATDGNVRNLLQIPAGLNGPAMTVNNLTIDGTSNTTNVINLSAMPPIKAYPVEIPLIQYASFSGGSGMFNIGMGTFPNASPPYAGTIINDGASNTIAVVVTAGPIAAAPQPTRFTVFSLSGTTLTLSGTNGTPNGQYVVLTTTNVVLPLTNWTALVTNYFDVNGHFSFSETNNSPKRFFTIKH